MLFGEELSIRWLLIDLRKGANDLSAFKRYPSQLRRYLSWSSEIKVTHGSIPNFVCEERLHWRPSRIRPDDMSSGLKPRNPTPFADPADYKILRNDWPYATPPDVAHLVVWLKTPLAVSKPESHLLPEGQAQIELFVNRTFTEPLKTIYEKDYSDRVLWFKNWSALQSVRSLEHFHCFVRGAGEQLLEEWTAREKVMKWAWTSHGIQPLDWKSRDQSAGLDCISCLSGR
jgi:hypothetical protein